MEQKPNARVNFTETVPCERVRNYLRRTPLCANNTFHLEDQTVAQQSGSQKRRPIIFHFLLPIQSLQSTSTSHWNINGVKRAPRLIWVSLTGRGKRITFLLLYLIKWRRMSKALFLHALQSLNRLDQAEAGAPFKTFTTVTGAVPRQRHSLHCNLPLCWVSTRTHAEWFWVKSWEAWSLKKQMNTGFLVRCLVHECTTEDQKKGTQQPNQGSKR